MRTSCVPGDVTKPIVYDVDRIRDGASFTTRRVVAIQSGAAIFNLAASFQKEEAGFEHQDAMPEVPAPESCPHRAGAPRRSVAAPAHHPRPRGRRAPLRGKRACRVRPVGRAPDRFHPSPHPPRRVVWLRAADAPVPGRPGLAPVPPRVRVRLLVRHAPRSCPTA